MLSPLYQGQTCQPPSIFDESGECTQGGYPLYVVKATNVAQIQLAVNFARNTGIRLVIKNTGHDFSGKSGGAGSLSVWTHHLKDIAYIPDYEDCEYSGRAMKAGVGVQGFELYTAANNLGLVAMGGECPTVGILGGWVQGGGHSPLGSIYGMGADHVLGFEVVTADGRFVTANANENTDLFWALRGGGGGDYGIVTSVIFKVYEDLPVTTASWTFTSGENVTDKAFSAGLKAWFEMLPSNVDNGVYTYFQVFNLGTSKMFIMTPWFAANKSIDESKELLQPWLARMSELNIPVVPEWKSYDGFYEAYNKSFPVESVMPAATATAARFFRRENFIKEDLLDETFDTFWRHIENGQALMGFNLGPTWTRGGEPDNSVNPAWRDAVLHLITAVSLDTTESVEYQMEQRLNFTNGPMKEWRDLTPGGGGYMSEGDRLEPNFQWNFFGSFYPRLLEIKQRYDPFNLFYAHRAVGSEFFEVRGETVMSDENGRLCVKENPTHYQAEGPDWVPQ